MVVVERVEEPVATRFVVVRLVKNPETEESNDEKKLVLVALVTFAEVAERLLMVRVLVVRLDTVVVARTVVPVRVLSPENVCVPVDTTPREDTPALGMLMVCVEPTEEIPTSVPAVPTVRN
jgi:hypothetical protein